ncbi:ABC transporter substrate-binding protein [Streptomyces litchfieldiae]|uniref:Sugar ABC transporter substrate-binding protein n=1 Tax=Streptomyces litchfieldiae TaxID=3075543 RepID=A0ABU2MYT0_9ACTN|nr:sugar ABC transporter substrate-binding protein [Streptomyces sp. DSM 44938]MDT0346199.1 sugar ABC transporter substrate-binding protein [Streptomyces sp. DSM 44938]
MELTRGRFLSLLGAGAAGVLLGGCAKSPPPVDVTAAGFGTEATGTVKLWCRSALQAANQLLVDRFHAAQDRIRVELTPVQDAQFVTKLATAIRGGRVPDIVDIDDINSALFINRGVFADLTPLIEALPFRDQLSPAHLALGEHDGRYYALPSVADNSALWCNLELLDRAGVDIDEATGSFDGYLDAARAVSGLGRDVHGWSFPGNGSGALGFTVQPHIWATDTDLITGEIGHQRGDIVGNDALRRTLGLLHTLWDEGLVPSDADADDASRWAANFHAGRIGMMPNGYGILVPQAPPGLLDHTEVRLLSGPDGGRSFFDGGTNFCLPNGSDNPSAAWEFALFCLDVEQQARLPESGYIPVRSDAATPEFRADYPLALPSLEDIGAGYAPLTLAYNRIYNQSDGPWLAMFRRAVFGGDIDGAMAQAQDHYDEILRQGDA